VKQRPILRWHGGKWILAPWIISHFPNHRVYCEPFAGAASVLLRKERSYSEVINDINDDLFNLFEVMRDRHKEFIEAVRMTPFSRREFERAYSAHPCPIEKARRFAIRSFQGFGSVGAAGTESTGWRSNSHRPGTTPAKDWANLPGSLELAVERLRGVIIENRDWQSVVETHDSDQTLFYFDPPYLEQTRTRYGVYSHEMTDGDHLELLDRVKSIKGRVIISGYASETYDKALKNWRRETKQTNADGAKKREEILWIKP
jgi:DNA adenine methylase